MTEKEFSKHIAQLISTIVEKSDKYELTLKADATMGVTAEFSVYHPQLESLNKTSRYYLSGTDDQIVREKTKEAEMLLLARLSGAPLEYVPSIHGEWKEGMKL